mmetsp:Transcript_25608/g.73606  ORF Transcript_25608/g.73606 Transcript_25608/m.73606 type:complete len:772 (+) Transcript_25608:86-2401(+)
MLLVSVEPVDSAQVCFEGLEEPVLSLKLGINIRLRGLADAILRCHQPCPESPAEQPPQGTCDSSKPWDQQQLLPAASVAPEEAQGAPTSPLISASGSKPPLDALEDCPAGMSGQGEPSVTCTLAEDAFGPTSSRDDRLCVRKAFEALPRAKSRGLHMAKQPLEKDSRSTQHEHKRGPSRGQPIRFSGMELARDRVVKPSRWQPIGSYPKEIARYRVDRSQPREGSYGPRRSQLHKAERLVKEVNPENVDRIIECFRSIQIASVEELDKLMSCLIEKVLSEPPYCVTYADLMSAFNSSYLQSSSGAAGGSSDTFGRLLMNTLQNTFENCIDKCDEQGLHCVDVIGTPTSEVQHMRKCVHRLVQFTGHLFVRGLFPLRVIRGMSHELLRGEREYCVEYACELLQAIGYTLDITADGKAVLAHLLHCLRDLCSSLSQRVHSKVHSLLDLARRGWQGSVLRMPGKTIHATAPGGLKAILEAMSENLEDAGIQRQGCEALEYLVRESRGRTKYCRVLAAGGLEATLTALSKHPRVVDVQQKGCRAIAALAGGLNMPTRERCLHAGAVEATLKEHCGEAAVQSQGCEALNCLAGDSVGREWVIVAGGLEATVDAMRLHLNDASVQTQGCGVVRIFAGCKHLVKECVLAAGGLDATLDAMMMHPRDTDAQRAGCRALVNIIRNTPSWVWAQCLAARGVELLLKAMRRHLEDQAVQQLGCIVVELLASDDRCRAMVIAAGGFRDVAKAMVEHPNDTCIQRQKSLKDQLYADAGELEEVD